MTDAGLVAEFVWTHPANHGKRTRAMARAIRFQARGGVLHRRTLARLGDRSLLWAGLHRPGASKVVYSYGPDVFACPDSESHAPLWAPQALREVSR